MPKRLIVIRGLPGSGKTTLARLMKALAHRAEHLETDMYFTDPGTGTYKFEPEDLPNAHRWCQILTNDAFNDVDTVIVSNTFVREWELSPYRGIAKKNEAEFHVISLFDSGHDDKTLFSRSSHYVPLETICMMRQHWEGFDR